MQTQTTAPSFGREAPTGAQPPTRASSLIVSTTPYRNTARRPQIWRAAPKAKEPSYGRPGNNLLRAS